MHCPGTRPGRSAPAAPGNVVCWCRCSGQPKMTDNRSSICLLERKGSFRTHKAAWSLPLKHTEPHSSCSQLLQRVQSSSSTLQHPLEQPRVQLNTPGYCPARVTSYRKHNGPSSVFLCKRPLRSLPTNPPAKRCCPVSVLTDQHPSSHPPLHLFLESLPNPRAACCLRPSLHSLIHKSGSLPTPPENLSAIRPVA